VELFLAATLTDEATFVWFNSKGDEVLERLNGERFNGREEMARAHLRGDVVGHREARRRNELLGGGGHNG
jgi:hypothetical protein